MCSKLPELSGSFVTEMEILSGIGYGSVLRRVVKCSKLQELSGFFVTEMEILLLHKVLANIVHNKYIYVMGNWKKFSKKKKKKKSIPLQSFVTRETSINV